MHLRPNICISQWWKIVVYLVVSGIVMLCLYSVQTEPWTMAQGAQWCEQSKLGSPDPFGAPICKNNQDIGLMSFILRCEQLPKM